MLSVKIARVKISILLGALISTMPTIYGFQSFVNLSPKLLAFRVAPLGKLKNRRHTF